MKKLKEYGKSNMNRCKSLLGFLFGHKFTNFLIHKSGLKHDLKIERLYGHADAIQEFLDKTREENYTIICKRCGIKIDE